MKIAGTGPVQTSPLRRRTKTGEASGSAFAEQLGSSRPTPNAAPTAQTNPIDGLFLLQEVDEDGRGRQQARERGEALLDRLDEIRDALLAGTMNASTLNRLLSQIREKKGDFTDPGLRDVLDAIELRAAVELAKFGRSA